MKNVEWFEWERQATIHPILLCMESWMEPTKKYCGRAWPTSYMKYTKDIGLWINRESDLLDYGNYLLEIYVQEKNRTRLETDITRIAQRFDSRFKHIDHLTLSKLPDSNLLQEYEELVGLFVEWFVPGAFVEPIGLAGEERIRTLLRQKGIGQAQADSYVSILTTTPKKSFSKQELEDLVATVKDTRSFEDHARRWHWIHNNYYATEVLDARFFKEQAASLSQKHGDLATHVEKMNIEFHRVLAQKRRYLDELALSKPEANLILLLELFAWYQDYRKEYTMRFLHYLDLFLREIGARSALSLTQMRYSMRSEIPAILKKTFDTKLLDLRMKHFLFVWDYEKSTFNTYTSDALSVWNVLDPHISHHEEHLEIAGQPASRGIVRGHARVTMNAKDAHDLKAGEILITSMTTPDFVTAMKKAGAVVTNEGGILCHAAVISREFGIPCVVGTKIATKMIHTGDLVEVDGEKGTVRKL